MRKHGHGHVGGSNGVGRGLPIRFLALILCASAGLLWACCELVLMEKPCPPELQAREQQLAFSTNLRRQQAQERHIASLEKQLAAARRGSPCEGPISSNEDAGLPVTVSGSSVAALQAENKKLRERNEFLEERVRWYSSVEQPQQILTAQAPPVGEPRGRRPITMEDLKVAASKDAIAVVVISCKRPKYLQRSMESILKASRDAEHFPIIISQDAHDETMTSAVESAYVATGIAFHMHHDHDPKASQIAKTYGKVQNTLGYVRIAQHYGFAMRTVFDDMGFQQVIFLEEDMEIAPDFFSYFQAMLPLLKGDQQLFCVSAWNDNGYASLVEDPSAVYRTDFFPGLGWMMEKRFWAEIRDRFAVAYWDEFMRRSDVRKGRHCIRPDISRSMTFGVEGESHGQFYKDHLKYIRLNDVAVDWSRADLHFLSSAPLFDQWLEGQLQKAISVTLSEIDRVQQPDQVIRIEYDDAKDYAKKVAVKFGLMPDEKEGIRRMSYRGVIPFSWKGNRVLLYTRKWPGIDD